MIRIHFDDLKQERQKSIAIKKTKNKDKNMLVKRIFSSKIILRIVVVFMTAASKGLERPTIHDSY